MPATVDNASYARFMRRSIRALGRRVGAGDVAALPELVALRAEVDAAIVNAVAELRAEPHAYSWTEIGAALGITRQAAQTRFGDRTPPGARRPGGQPASLR